MKTHQDLRKEKLPSCCKEKYIAKADNSKIPKSRLYILEDRLERPKHLTLYWNPSCTDRLIWKRSDAEGFGIHMSLATAMAKLTACKLGPYGRVCCAAMPWLRTCSIDWTKLPIASGASGAPSDLAGAPHAQPQGKPPAPGELISLGETLNSIATT